MPRPTARPARMLAWCALLALPLVLGGCSLRKFAANSVGNSLANGPDVFSSEDDPDLVRDAVPFGLKTMESLLAIVPDNKNLLLALCKGFTQYAFAFVQADADEVEPASYERATELRERALRLYLRARGYGLRGLDRAVPGVSRQLVVDPQAAVRRFRRQDVPVMFWTAAAWGSAINLGKDRAELVADLPAVRALIERGLALDEGFEGGSLHEAMIVLEALPPAMGGSPERAKQHFDRAVELSHGVLPGPFLTYAQSVSVMNQDRAQFHTLLERALAIDPGRDSLQRLQTLVTQRRARMLLAREDELFLDAASDSTAPDTTTNEGSH